MREHHFTFAADDGAKLFVYRWLPDVGCGKAVVHIAHGLAEHAGRYERLAEELTEHGYIVFANDHRGHGKTAQSLEELGYFSDENGWQRVLKDIEQISQVARRDYFGHPVVLFGHSMGSLIAQHLATWNLFDAVAMSGANGLVSPLVHVGKLITRIERARLGRLGKSELLNKLSFDAFNKPFAPNRTAFDWLSRDEDEVDKYIADPMCGFLCSTQLWLDMLDAITQAAKPEFRAKVPKELPIYLFSGSRDTANAEGRGSTALAEHYRSIGMEKVSYRIFTQARHETLNETNREEVTEHLIDWMNAIVKLLSYHPA
ncbi:MAG TPA: alpha/beta hydrolase [Blastocatellia bacterium]|nr:alpha/beta hydrolase [Blastocatellia bacterium]HMV86545.1 alpha/beta hydrolase [Blastocatellia bacterium]HMX24990.1 alpha/beta hydrolase [Blastocatellia bacterium]HMY70619.1 alpha/beta hydrolase [Blastocatellia bacterium]HMZ20846.1 alpha/beta hydrolase [Blastocatellia bacterium]